MAILDIPKLRGMEVTIHFGGQALQEYGDDQDVEAAPGEIGAYQASRTVSKYIESVTGQKYSVELSLQKPFKFDCPSLAYRISIDGVETEQDPLALRRGYSAARGWTRSVEGIKSYKASDKTSSLRKFKFSAINTSKCLLPKF